MSKKNKSISWSFPDWELGTKYLSRLHRACYMDLLGAQFEYGHLSLERIESILGEDFLCWNVLSKKFKQDSDGLFYNQRLENEVLRVKSISDSRSKNGKVGGDANARQIISKREANEKQTRSKREANASKVDGEVLVWPTFDDFWGLYDKKIDRPRSVSAWNKLSQKEKELVMAYLPNYIISRSDKQYRKNPASFLFNRGWENEIIIPEQKLTNQEQTLFGYQQLKEMQNERYKDS